MRQTLSILLSILALATGACGFNRYSVNKPQAEESISIASLYQSLDPDTRSRVNLGVLMKQGYYKEAEAGYLKLIEKLETSTRPRDTLLFTYVDLGDLYMGLGRYTDAIGYYVKSLELLEDKNVHRSLIAKLNIHLSHIYNTLEDNLTSTYYYDKAVEIWQMSQSQRIETGSGKFNDLWQYLIRYVKTEAEIRAELARIYEDCHNYSNAETQYLKVLSIYENNDPHSHDTIKSLVMVGSFYVRNGNISQSEFYYQKAIATLESSHQYANNTDVSAKLFSRFASEYERARNPGKAEIHYRKALEVLERDSPHSLAVAEAAVNLAEFYRVRFEYSNADIYFRKALDVYQQNNPDSPKVVITCLRLAELNHLQSHYKDSEYFYDKALNVCKRSDPTGDYMMAISSRLVLLYTNLASHDRAEPLLRELLSIIKKTQPNTLKEAAISLMLGQTCEELGANTESESLYARVLDIIDNIGLEEQEDIALLCGLAGHYLRGGDYERGTQLAKRAIDIYDRLGPDKIDPDYLIVLAELFIEKSLYDKAETIYSNILATAKSVSGIEGMKNYHIEDHPKLALVFIGLASVYSRTQRYTEAETLLKNSLNIATRNDIPVLRWKVYAGFMDHYTRKSKTEQAIFFGKQAINIIQTLRSEVRLIGQESQRSFLKRVQSLYRDLADLLISQGRIPEAQHVLSMLKEEEYYEFIKRDSAEKRTTIGFNTEEKRWLIHWEEISGRIASIDREITEIRKNRLSELSPVEDQKLRTRDADLIVAINDLNELFLQLEAGFSQPRNNEKSEDILFDIRLPRLVKELGHNSVIIHYLIRDTYLHILLTTPNTYPIARRSEISSAELHLKIDRFTTALNDRNSKPIPLAHDLFNILISPIREDLVKWGAKVLMVYLDGDLRYVPFAALHDGERYLIEDYSLACFTAASRGKIDVQTNRHWRLAGMGVSQEVSGFPPLPAVPEELTSIIRDDKRSHNGLFPGIICLDSEFTRDNFRKALQEKYPVFHIASHFVFQPGTDEDSYLLLGDGSRLNLTQIRKEDYDLASVELLTLSACRTAIGNLAANGIEVEGLGVLAQKKGAKAVLATLWPIHDESTSILMKYFYQLRKAKPSLTKAEALREAQLFFIKHGMPVSNSEESTRSPIFRPKAKNDAPDISSQCSHPYYWAPFILMGNWL